MRKKIVDILGKIYGALMMTSFFAGILPLIPFIVAICIGGETGEKISLFLYKDFYPWVILLASVAILIGLVAMYISKTEGLSLKSVTAKNEEEKNEDTKNDESNPDVVA